MMHSEFVLPCPAQVPQRVHRVVVLLQGTFLSPAAGFVVPDIAVDFPQKRGAPVPVHPDLPAADHVSFRSWRNGDAVEIVAVLVVPDPPMDLRCELTRVLCGLNCDPWRIQDAK